MDEGYDSTIDSSDSASEFSSDDTTENLSEDTSTDLDEDTSTDLDEDASTNLDEDTSTDLDEDTTTDLDEDTAADMDEDTSAGLDEDAVTDLDEDTATDMDEGTSTDLDENTTTDLDEDTAADMDEDTSAGLDEDAVTDLDEDTATDIDKDTSADQDEETMTDNDEQSSEGTEAETSEGADDDAAAADEAADVQISDTDEQPEDASNTEATDKTSEAEDAVPTEQTDEVTDAVADETTDVQDSDTEEQPEDTSDTEATDKTSEAEDVEPAEQTDEITDAAADETSGVQDSDISEQPEDALDTEATDETSDAEDAAPTEQTDEATDATSDETADVQSSDTSEQPEDATTINDKQTDASSDIAEKSAQDRMAEYMSSHNYGLDDKGTYMSDPEWISINRDLKAELGIPQTAQEQMADYLGSHNYGRADYPTYSKDPEWQAINAALQSESSGENVTTGLNNAIDTSDAGEEKTGIAGFFSNLFGKPSEIAAPETTGGQISTTEYYEPSTEAGTEAPTSQILQEPSDVPTPDDTKDFVKTIEQMDYNDLSDENKDLMYNTAKEHIGEKYGDLVSDDRLNEIPKHIKIADTEECRKAYEASGGRYGDNTVGFYCPATDEIYVDAPRNGDMTEIMATIEHESLHLASNGGVNGSIEVSDGVSTYRRSTNLNEGVTELYAMRDMDDMGFDYHSSSYQQQVDVVRSLEDAIGRDTIRTAYFGNKPDLIRSEFERAFASGDELSNLKAGQTIHNGRYVDFLNSFDEYISTHPNDPNYSSRRDKVYNLIAQCKSGRRL